MDRPSTSKARGICRYYTTPRGCFAKDNCKFLHGEEEKLTPYDKSKSCKFYANGYCRRGDECWFRHAAPGLSPSQQDDTSDLYSDDECNICMEKPATYGLLTGCGHVFCIKCIRQWRDPAEKSGDMVFSGVIKKCPLCRAPSKFVTPSSSIFSHNDPNKAAAIDKYKASMARVPCRYFQQSKPAKRFCPFGRDCFYQHLNADGTAHIFPDGVDYYMKLYKCRRDLSENTAYAQDLGNPLSILGRIFEDPFEDLNATIEALRVNLPAFLERLSMEERDADGDADGSSDEGDDESAEGADGENGYRSLGGATRTLEHLAVRMFQSFEALRDSAQPSPSPGLQSNAVEDTFDDLPPLEPVQARQSLGSDSIPPRETLSPSPVPSPSWAPGISATSRFSTIVSNRSQERVLIDIASEDEEDDEDATSSEGTEQVLAGELCNATGEAPLDAADPERDIAMDVNDTVQEPAMADLDGRAGSVIAEEIGSSELTSNSASNAVTAEHSQPEQEAEPPFVTDGRGRVVWSSTRSGRGTQAPAPADVPREAPGQTQVSAVRTPMGNISERRMKRRAAREPSTDARTDSTGFTTDGRGRVIWTESPVQTQAGGANGEHVDSDGGSQARAEAGVEARTEFVAERVVAESSNDGARRSFLGRVFDVMFS